MDNISTVGKTSMVRDILLGTLSPPLGENPQDHFMQPAAHSGNQLDDSEAENVLMSIFQQVVEELPDEDKELLANFVGLGSQREAPPSLEDVEAIITQVVEDAIHVLSEEGAELPDELSQSTTRSLAVMSIAQEVLMESQRQATYESASEKRILPSHEALSTRLAQIPEASVVQPSKKQKSEEGPIIKEVAQVSAYYLKGLHHISAHYGEPTSYRAEAILTAGGSYVITPQVSTILPMAAMLGEVLHTTIQKEGDYLSKEIGMSGKILNKSDLVLDSKLTHAILSRTFEALEKDQKTNQQIEFALKIHPKSMGEVNVVINANREQINIAVQGSPEAVDKIKGDIVYFSNQYDNMKWKLNDQDVGKKGQGKSSGDQSSQDENSGDLLPEDMVKDNRIINLII